ncbi:MAG: hypothetical protein DYH13_08360 [Alphaproteobacteria bacterium PRO2]|nr:hypothetical protein [Alphaproteobacteria bacterium PRO2]
MSRYPYIVVFALFFTVLLARPAAAEMEVQDGHTRTEPGVGEYYDIYSRRIAYMQENVKFRRDLETRRKNFTAMREEVIQRYENNLKASHGNYEQEQPGSEHETAGPPAPDAAGLNP